MDTRAIREQLGRVKPYYMRNETMRALNAALMGVKGVAAMGITPSLEIRGAIREAVQLLSRDELVKKMLKAPLMYQPGQERQLLSTLAGLYKACLEEAGREDHDTALARKQKLDQAYNLGMKLLGQGQISEADSAFAEAVTYYKDEHRVFVVIGKALLAAGEDKRALTYLRRGLEVCPDDDDVKALMEAAGRGKGDVTESAR